MGLRPIPPRPETWGTCPPHKKTILSQMWVRGRFLFQPFLTTNRARRHRASRENAPQKREAFRREPSPKANPKGAQAGASSRPSRKRASATRKPLPSVVDGTKTLSRLYRACQSAWRACRSKRKRQDRHSGGRASSRTVCAETVNQCRSRMLRRVQSIFQYCP